MAQDIQYYNIPEPFLNHIEKFSLSADSVSQQQDTFLSRFSSKVLTEGSFFSSFLILSASIGGSGMLALPYTFHLCGWPAGMSTILLCMLVNLFTCYIVVQATVKKNMPTLDQLFCDSVEINLPWVPNWVNSFVYKTLIRYTELSIVLNNYGTVIIYIIAGETLMQRALHLLGETGLVTSPVLWAVVLTIMVFLPFAFVNEIATLRYPSLLSVVTTLYVAGVIIGEFGYSGAKSTGKTQWSLEGELKSIPVILFTSTTQQNIGLIVQVGCIQNLKKKEEGVKLLICVMVFETTLFLSVGFCGYFMPGMTHSNVLDSSDYTDLTSITVRAKQAMLLMTVSLLSANPIMIYPLVTVLYHMAGEHRRLSSRLVIGSVVLGKCQVVTLASATAIAIAAQNYFYFVIGLVGAVTCFYVCIIVPCVWYIRSAPEDEPGWMKYMCWVVLVGMSCSCVASLVVLIAVQTSE